MRRVIQAGYPVNIYSFFISAFLLFALYAYLVLNIPSAVTVFLIILLSVFCLLRPEWSYTYALLFMFFTSFFFELDSNDKIRFQFIELFAIAGLFSWLLRSMTHVRRPGSFDGVDLLLFIFLLWATISLLWTEARGQGLFELYKLIAAFSLYFLTRKLLVHFLYLKRVIIVLTVVGSSVAILTLASVWMDHGYREIIPINSNIDFFSYLWAKKTWASDGGRGEGTAVSHTMGVLLNMVIFLTMGLYLITHRIKEKWIYGFSIFLMTAGMASTLTKSAIVSYILGAMFIIIHVRKLRSKLITSFFLLLSGFIAVFGLSRIRDIEKSLTFSQHQLDAGDSATSMGTRLDWWGEGLKELIDSAGQGYGIGGFRAAVDNVIPDGSHHAVLFDLGLIGFTIYILIFGFCFFVFYRHLRQCNDDAHGKLMLTYLAGYLVMMLSWAVTLYYTYAYMWFYLGLGFVIMNLEHTVDKKSATAESGKAPFIAMLTDHVR